MKALHAAAFGAGAALVVGSAASAMNDPTRPPASLGETAGTAASVGTVLRAPPVLQSVIIGRLSRAAIIDGERVEIGGRYRDAQVVRITEDEVVLRKDNITQVLKMYPDVEKKNVPPPRPAVPRSKPP